MSMKYTRLTIEERETIHALVNQGKTNREIASELKRSHTTIARELKRCRTRLEYSPSKAHTHAGRLLPSRGRKPIIDIRPQVWYEAIQKLVEDFSPEQISKTFKIEYADENYERYSPLTYEEKDGQGKIAPDLMSKEVE